MGKPAARIGDKHVCPMFDGPKPHVGGPVAGPGVPSVLIGGMPAAVMGDMCTCAGPIDSIVMGSSGVFIGGKPAARFSDQCAHGGKIVVGCTSVLIGENGSGGVGLGAMPISALMNVMKAGGAIAKKAAQVIALKLAAANGIPFCEKCAEAIMKGK